MATLLVIVSTFSNAMLLTSLLILLLVGIQTGTRLVSGETFPGRVLQGAVASLTVVALKVSQPALVATEYQGAPLREQRVPVPRRGACGGLF